MDLLGLGKRGGLRRIIEALCSKYMSTIGNKCMNALLVCFKRLESWPCVIMDHHNQRICVASRCGFLCAEPCKLGPLKEDETYSLEGRWMTR